MTRPVCLVLCGLLTLLATGCNATKRELTVVFTSTATQAEHAAALRACTGVAPHTSPEPMPTDPRYDSSNVRFRIDSANDHDIALLEGCLNKQQGVLGFQDSADST